jgi:protein-S-isoprenylcysteine O-methyltransferase Ste14
MSRGVTARGLAEAGASIALAVMYGAFAAAHLRAFTASPRASLVLVVAMETLAAAFILLRRSAKSVSLTPWAFATTTLGTFLPLLFRPAGVRHDSPVGQVVQVAGLAMAIAAFASLNRSLGLLPANRGVRTGGAYRLVRHPLYASYTLMNAGYLLSNLGAWNAVVLVGAFAGQVLRIRAEEAFLSGDPEYAAYARRTRWRLLPFVY